MWPPPKGLYLDEYFNLHYPSDVRHGDSLDPGLEEILDQHWTEYPPQNPVINLLVGVAMIVLLFMSILGNGVVLYIFIKTSSLRTSSNIFIINLALSDLIMMLTHGLPVGINIFIKRYWMWGVLNCKIFAMLGGITGTVSIMSMVFIGYDRCKVIVGGITAERISKSTALMMVVGLWAYAILSSIGPFLGWGHYGLEGLLITCSYDYIKKDWGNQSFILYTLITHFCIPMVFVIYFYTKITKAVISHEAELRSQAKKMGVDSLKNKKKDQTSQEVKIAKVAITNVLLWIGTWSPYAVVVMIGLTGNYSTLTPLVAGMPSLLIKTTSSFNPLVFAVAHPAYREALATEIPCLGIGKKPSAKDNKSEATRTSATPT